MMLPLEGVKVIELAQFVAGPFAGRMLADVGADVIKIEAPGGDPTRQIPPDLRGIGTRYLDLNRNKRSIVVNLKDPDGQEIVRRLAREADVLLQNLRPGDVETFGLAYGDLSALNPRLVYCSISGYGPGGPLADQPAFEFALQAFSGFMSVTGEPDRAPVRAGGSVVDIPAGMCAAAAISFALNGRQQTGRGSHVEVSLFESLMSILAPQVGGHLATGKVPRRWGSANAGSVPYQAFQTSDGDITVGAGSDKQFVLLCRTMNLERLANDERYATMSGRVAYRDSLITELAEVFRTQSSEHWLSLLRTAGVICAPINTIPEAVRHPQAQSIGLLAEVPHPAGGTFETLSAPMRFDGAHPRRLEAPPSLGQHTDEILRESGYTAEQIAAWRATGAIA